MEIQLIVILGLVASVVALPIIFDRNQGLDGSTLENSHADNIRIKRQYNVPQAAGYDFSNFAAPSQNIFYQGRANNFENTPIFNDQAQPANNFLAPNRGLTNQLFPYVPQPQINSFNDYASQQLRNNPNAHVVPFQYSNSQYSPEDQYFSPNKFNTPISRSDNYRPEQFESQSIETSPRNFNAIKTPLDNPQEYQNNGRTFFEIPQSVPLYFSQTRPSEIWSNIKEEVTPFINAYSRTAQEQNTPVQTAPIYYNSQSDQNSESPAITSNIRQIIPSPQEVFNSALNIGNRIIERIPGYQLTANVVGFVGNITRTGAHILNNQLQGQFRPIQNRPLAFPNPRPMEGPVQAYPVQLQVPYPATTAQQPVIPTKITTTITAPLNDKPISSTAGLSEQYRPSSEENDIAYHEDESPEHHGSQEEYSPEHHEYSQEAHHTSQEAQHTSQESSHTSHALSTSQEEIQMSQEAHHTSQEAQQTSQESSHTSHEVQHTSQETGPSQLNVNHVSNEESLQITEDEIRHDSQENNESIGDFNNPVTPEDDDILNDDDDRINPKSVHTILG